MPPAPIVREPIQVYVRKLDDDARSLSFRLPEGLPQADLVEKRVALDGNQALWTVGPVATSGPTQWRGRFNIRYQPNLSDALAEEQAELVAWAKTKGYEVTFR